MNRNRKEKDPVHILIEMLPIIGNGSELKNDSLISL